MTISQDPQNPLHAAAPSSAVANLTHIQARIAGVVHGNRPAPIVIAVTKTVPAETIAPVIVAGHRHFGENRVQEAAAKWPALRKLAADITLHLIGPLQTNKVAEAVSLFDTIHTVDRPKLAEKLCREMDVQGRRPDCFVQVNTGREPQKAGVDPADADRFVAQCRAEFRLPIVGLMCVPPAAEEPSPHFALLREIARRNGLDRLSMGMSDDFEIALMFGTTHMRLGAAIFGARI